MVILIDWLVDWKCLFWKKVGENKNEKHLQTKSKSKQELCNFAKSKKKKK